MTLENTTIPKSLSARGREAARLLVAQAAEHDATYADGRVFYSPIEWFRPVEECGLGAVLIVMHESADVGRLLDYERAAPGGGPTEAYAKVEATNKALREAGFYAQPCTRWYAAIYDDDDDAPEGYDA